jgi:ferredoxin-NADP reductase
MKLRDFQGLLRTAELRLAEKSRAGGDQYIFDFTVSEGLQWRPGEHAIFNLRGHGVRGRSFRAFSVASIPEEGVVKVGTRISGKPSDFKETLRDLPIGETVHMRGPFGWFTLQDESSPLVMIAGGIGITPVRALFKRLEGNNRRRVHLIHSGSEHLFRGELEGISSRDPNIAIEYVGDRDEAGEAVTEYILQYGSHGYFYVSGVPGLIRATKKLLESLGVRRRQIINDPFLGY